MGILLTLRFPRFSQGLAKDATICRISFGIAINIFSSHFGQLANIFLLTSKNLFHGALSLVNIVDFGVYQWWYTIGLRNNEDLYIEAFFLLFLFIISLLGELFGVSSLTLIGHLVHVSILGFRGNLYYIFFLISSHMYITNFEIEHNIKDILEAHIPLEAQHMYSLPAYAFITQEFTTQAALYTQHHYIIRFIMTRAFTNEVIFVIRDYNSETNENNVLARIWTRLFLGFHTLGLYVYNDAMLAFGTPKKKILIEPIFTQWIRFAHNKLHMGSMFLS
uniref:Uncharacterized protein n=1 Tax=Populus trichocarpa TaxID=3694 RepID=A0A2K1X3K1_POPTR